MDPHATTSPATADRVMMNGSELAHAIASGAVSCAEVMQSTLDHIERLNPRVNAIVALRDREVLMEQARERDLQLARGDHKGWLHGFPLAIKDLEPVRGMVTSQGSPLLKDAVTDADSIMVERMRAAGAIFIGRTNVPEFGLGSHTFNPVYGTTVNAYDQSRSAGGSSGGAAVALALRMMPVADGTDYNGSLRNPAGWNNVFGLRTCPGRVPIEAADQFAPAMNVVGPMARTVPDLAMLLSVQAGYDPRAPLSIRQDPARFAADLGRDFAGVRIGWLGDFGGYLPFEPGVLALCAEALKTFEAIGCTIEEIRPDFAMDQLWRDFTTLRSARIATVLGGWYDDPASRALLKAEAVWEIEQGRRVSATDFAAASAGRTAWYRAIQKLFWTHEFLVLPSAQVFPFAADLRWPAEIDGQAMDTYHRWMEVGVPGTMAGAPVLCVPGGFDPRGLPIGLQIVGPNHGELACLQIAFAYERASGWSERVLPPLLQAA